MPDGDGHPTPQMEFLALVSVPERHWLRRLVRVWRDVMRRPLLGKDTSRAPDFPQARPLISTKEMSEWI